MRNVLPNVLQLPASTTLYYRAASPLLRLLLSSQSSASRHPSSEGLEHPQCRLSAAQRLLPRSQLLPCGLQQLYGVQDYLPLKRSNLNLFCRTRQAQPWAICAEQHLPKITLKSQCKRLSA